MENMKTRFTLILGGLNNMKYKEIKYKNKKLIRINSKKAYNIINHPKTFDGVTLYMLPINTNPDCIFINGFFELTMDFNSMDAIDNNRYINEIIYYNCNNELGKYLKYYIEEREDGTTDGVIRKDIAFTECYI